MDTELSFLSNLHFHRPSVERSELLSHGVSLFSQPSSLDWSDQSQEHKTHFYTSDGNALLATLCSGEECDVLEFQPGIKKEDIAFWYDGASMIIDVSFRGKTEIISFKNHSLNHTAYLLPLDKVRFLSVGGGAAQEWDQDNILDKLAG